MAGRRNTSAMGSPLILERVRRDVEVLAHAGLDTATFLAEVYESLCRAVPSAAACVATIDPATRLATGGFKFGALADRDDTDALWGLLEYGEVEETSFAQLAQAGVPSVGMRLSTGDAQRSRRMRDLTRSAVGCTDELRVVAIDNGQLWGGIALFRDARAKPYVEEEVAFVATLSGSLARGLRVGLLARLAGDSGITSATGPAVLLFDAEGRLCQASVDAEARLASLVSQGGAPAPAAVISAMVAAAWRYANGAGDVLPSARLRLANGEWVVLHGSPLHMSDGSAASVAITIEEARPPDIVPLVVAAFDLSPRERDVTQLVLQGVDTKAIAATLHISPHTVQDHLKSIFEKTGVRTRRELVARVFFDQYVPRMGAPLAPSGDFL